MKTNVITALLTISVGCIIGYQTSFTTVNATSTPKIIPKFVEVQKPVGFDLNINMNKESIEMKNSTDNNVNISIQRKDSIIYKYRTSIVEKEKPVYVRVSPSFVRIKQSIPTIAKNVNECLPKEKITFKN